MRLEQSFEVPVPVEQAWSVLLDVERIAPCMPGATLTGFDGTAFTGIVKVKLGPVSLAYKGHGHFAERDDAGRRVVIVASGQDSRGAGAASAEITAVLRGTGGGSATLVEVVTDLNIAGRAAQFGRGMIADISGKLIKQFADCLAQTIAAAPAPAPAPAPVAPPVHVEPAPAPAYVEPAPAPAYVEPAPAPAYEPSPAAAEPVTEPVAAMPVAQVAATETFGQVPTAPSGEAPSGEAPKETLGTAPIQPPAQAPRETLGEAPTQPPTEAEPIDLLALSGAKGMMRRAAPVLVVVALVVVGLIVWLVVA